MSKKRLLPPQLGPNCSLIDSHCHLDMDAYGSDGSDGVDGDNLDAVLARASAQGVTGVITIGIDEPSSIRAIELARIYPMVRATIGVHPHDAATLNEQTLTRLKELALANRDVVVAYGEIGLDYVKQYAEPEIQRRWFRAQLEMASELELPVVIHDREAHADTLSLLRESGPLKQGGIMHCFSGDLRLAQEVMDLGLLISIPGVVTFNKAPELQAVAAQIPLEAMLVETDGPFLAPMPWRGKRNEPLYALYTAAKIAELRGISIDEVALHTTRNCQRLLNFPPAGAAG